MARAVLLVLSFMFALALAVRPGTTERNHMVFLHNQLRSNVNPPAQTPIPPLNYDIGLEGIASNYSDLCIWGHNNNRGSNVGENIAAYSGSYSDILALFSNANNDWGSEVEFWTYPRTCVSGQMCGHYTQQIWAATSLIGCGFTVCSNSPPWGGSGQWSYVVCDYASAGNVGAQSPYVQGTGGTSTTPTASASSPASPSASRTRSSSSLPASPSRTATKTNTATISKSPSNSASATVSTTKSRTASISKSSTISVSKTRTGSTGASASSSGSISKTRSATATPTATISQSATRSASITNSASRTKTTSPAAASVSATKTRTASACTAVCPSGYCGSYTNCGTTLTCGCPSGQQCVGTTCQASGGNPSWIYDFSVTHGNPQGLAVPDTIMSVIQPGAFIIPFNRSASVMDKYFSQAKFSVQISTGEFGVAFRHNQPSGVNTMLGISVAGIGTGNPLLHYMLWWGNSIYWEDWDTYSVWNAGGTNDITVTMSFDDSTQNVVVTWEQSGWWYQIYCGAGSFPNLGEMAFYTNIASPSVPSITHLTFATRTTLTVSLVGCIDTATWTSMFYSLTGADPNVVSVQIRPNGANANCAKEAIRGVEFVADSFTLVLESSGAASSVVAQSFIDFSSTAAATPMQIASVSVVSGTEGAILAGVTPLNTQVAVAVGSGGGGGAGGGGGGLSGGEIAGIVIGSVGGATIATAVVLGVVAAAVVGAVVIAKKKSSGESSSDPEPLAESLNDEDQVPNKRATWRQTIANIFRAPRGGVNVMGNDPKSHQSITARAPPVVVA